MNIGVIGTGDIGAVIVKKLRDAGYPQGLTNVGRSSLITNKEKGTKVYRVVENADYQAKANASRSLFNKKMKQ